jgi:hypothetical protein
MRCNASPTTCTAADAERVRLVTSTLDAVLFREILKPLATALGPVGDTALAAVTDRLFVPPPS